jgi:formate dehydrogenase subunit gamma
VGWLRALGGYFSRRHAILPAGRFNAGQKIWFYLALVLGGLVGLSGGLLYVPALLGPPAGIAFFIAHTVFAVALSALVVAHVYVAVLAHPYGLRAMITGKSDEACLGADHPLEITGRRA